MKRLALIANPTAGANAMNAVRGGNHRRRLIAAITKNLRAANFNVQLHLETSSLDVEACAARAARDGVDIIVAAGGDGTINSVLNGMMLAREEAFADGQNGLHSSLGVLPLGTGNVFAFNLGLPREWENNCEIIAQGYERVIDVGLAKTFEPQELSRYFLLMAGIGYDAKVIEETSLRMKYVLRDFAYALKSLENAVRHEGTQMTLRFDDKKVFASIAWLAMVGNAASYAWNIKVTPHAELDDGLLDVCLMPFENKFISMHQAMQMLTGQHVERGTAQYWQVKTLRVECSPNVPIQLDGDEWSSTPVEFSIVPGALKVLSPTT